jgi:dienelactone hydrolase
MRLSWRGAVAVAALVGAVISMVGLGVAQRGGGIEVFGASYGDDIPATVYMPEKDPPAPVPVVVMAHGYSGDRVGLSTLARWLAHNGYAAVTFDVRGHGTNNHPLVGDIRNDLTAVLDRVDDGGDFDRTRIALVGHSMGAFLVADEASKDDRIRATVALVGGETEGPVRPKNILFLLSSDTDETHAEGRKTAAKIVGRPLKDGEVVGDFASGTAVGLDTVKTSVAMIITSPGAGERTIKWLDQALGVKRSGPIDLDQNRRPWLLLSIPFVLVLLAAAGFAVGRLAPERAEVAASRWGIALLVVLGALIVPAPFTTIANPAGFLPIDVADGLVGELALAGVALFLAARWVQGSPEITGAIDRRSLTAAAAGFGALYLLMQPIGPFLHELVPTPKRLIVGSLLAAGFFVFTLPLERWIRRGTPWQAAGVSAAARVLILAFLQVGAAVGVVPGFLLLIMPLLVVAFLVIEVFAAGVYAAGRNVTVIAATGAATLGWIFGVFMPLRV